MAIRDNITENSVSQEIDLTEFFGREPTREEAFEFIELARETMIARTQSGEKRGGGRFTAYSPEYAEKKGSNEVDLTLFGDMLNSIEVEVSGNTARLYVPESDELNTKKSFNHHKGDTVPARPFFGITEKEARDIANQTKRITQEPSLIYAVGAASLFQQLQGGVTEADIGSILANIGLFGDQG